MGRKYSILIKIILSMFVACTCIRCTSTNPQFEEMVGIWKAKDGATIQLNADSSFIIKNFNSYFIYKLREDKIKTKIYATGIWSIHIQETGRVLLSMNISYAIEDNDSLFKSSKIESLLNHYGEQFYIKGDNGIFYDKKPWFIRAIDNIDDYNTYDFRRLE